MSRIKGWKKIGKDRWKPKGGGQGVQIVGKKRLWTVHYSVHDTLIKTKEGALKFARSWMRKHPKG